LVKISDAGAKPTVFCPAELTSVFSAAIPLRIYLLYQIKIH